MSLHQLSIMLLQLLDRYLKHVHDKSTLRLHNLIEKEPSQSVIVETYVSLYEEAYSLIIIIGYSWIKFSKLSLAGEWCNLCLVMYMYNVND